VVQELRNNGAIFSGLVRILRLLRALQMEIFSQCWERGDECMLVPFLKSKRRFPLTLFASWDRDFGLQNSRLRGTFIGVSNA
jgi:hypothetical protein